MFLSITTSFSIFTLSFSIFCHIFTISFSIFYHFLTISFSIFTTPCSIVILSFAISLSIFTVSFPNHYFGFLLLFPFDFPQKKFCIQFLTLVRLNFGTLSHTELPEVFNSALSRKSKSRKGLRSDIP